MKFVVTYELRGNGQKLKAIVDADSERQAVLKFYASNMDAYVYKAEMSYET